MLRHPLILAYNKTYDRNFPLILIIGREPNHESISDGMIGKYDFLDGQNRRCAFWNTSFSVLGSFNELSCKQIKQEFVNRQASPILFADAFSKGILNAVISKDIIRLEQSKREQAEQQVNAIFKHEDVISRLDLVLLSGQTHPMYDNFKLLINEKFAALKMPIREVPFFYPTNRRYILERFSDDDKELMRNIYFMYKQETDEI